MVPFAQEGLKGRMLRLAGRTSIQPAEEDLSVTQGLLEESIRKLTEARAERDRVADTFPSTRSKHTAEVVAPRPQSPRRRLPPRCVCSLWRGECPPLCPSPCAPRPSFGLLRRVALVPLTGPLRRVGCSFCPPDVASSPLSPPVQTGPRDS